MLGDMKIPILLLAAALSMGRLNAAEPTVAATNLVPATAPEVLVEGRCVKTPAGAVRLGFPGITFHLLHHGGSLAMRVNATSDQVYFDVRADGGEPVRLRCHAGDGDYALLDHAAAGDHELEITRRTESWEGTCDVLGFLPGSGERLLPPAALPERKLMFIGDSITCGAATDIRPDDPLKGANAHDEQTSNAGFSFGKILARRLNAQCHLVSYGGRGVIRDWQGIMTLNNAPIFYERALPDDPSSLWNPADYVPDAIVICLGTNDFSPGVPDENEFVNAYVEFVRKIRRDAPHAKIFLADSPMLWDAPGKAPKHTVLHAYLLETLEKINDPGVRMAPVKHYEGVPNNGHPTHANHEAIADEIEPLLRQALGWN
jgi:hypothetical protein